ncbi:MAG: DUF2155 domain-containing protein [candidate division NC10 bacterium]|nr:DUF2155 domain-containing protein [candidate division NC10 bacterium]
MTEHGPITKKLILFGVAIAIPLAAVALYFAVFDQPKPAPPAPGGAQPPAPSASAGGQAAPGQATLPPDHPPIAGGQGSPPANSGPSAPAGHPQTGATGRTVRVPDGVKGKWEAVKLRVEEKSGGKSPKVFTVKLGAQLAIPGSKLRVRVGDFLPALQVSGGEVTSASNEPKNPAVLVTVSEGGKETFRGWLFSKFPEMQPFEHPIYRITLVEGIPAS